MKLQTYNNCVFCGSKKMKIIKNQSFEHNFYTLAIKNDFNLKDNFFSKMKVYNCQKCYIIQNNPWFSFDDTFKIFNEIYGQHNRNWNNVLKFFKKGELPNHGDLFSLLNKIIQIKKYAEFNSPFMGLMLNFFYEDHKNNNKIFFEKIFSSALNYLFIRQQAGLSKIQIKKNTKLAKEYFITLNNLKQKKKKNSPKIFKTLIVDNSHLSWLYNDNYKSVNSRSLASGLFDIKVKNFNKNEKRVLYDLFGIFHTLDHTHQPKNILDYALKNSKYVIVYCHVDNELEKQHLFSLSDKFITYLKNQNIKVLNLTDKINKNYNSPEQYFLCSKNHKLPKL